MSDLSDEEAQELANKLLEQLSSVESRIGAIELRQQEEFEAMQARYALQLDPLVASRESVMDQITNLFSQHRQALTGDAKSAFLRAGKLSARTAPVAIEVDDEKSAITYLRRRHLLRRYAQQGDWKINKTALKKDLKLAAMIPGIRVVGIERLTVSLVRPVKELVRKLTPLRRSLS